MCGESLNEFLDSYDKSKGISVDDVTECVFFATTTNQKLCFSNFYLSARIARS